MIFPFWTFPAPPAAAFPNRAFIKRPILHVTLQRGTRSVNALAIVDSGADECVFPASLGTALGVPIPNPNVYVFSGTTDQPQNAYFDNIHVHVWKHVTPGEIAFSFDLYAGFCDTLEHVGLGLLGQNGFFSRYKVTIDHTNHILEVV
jgi:hypothetical protein